MKFPAEAGASDSKNYLRLKDKESATGIFIGDPYEFRTHWAGTKSDLCSEDSTCPHCAQGIKSSFRFRINFIIKEGAQYVAKVFEQGWTTYLILKQLHEGDYNLEKHVMKISRSGSGPHDTVYSILPTPNGIVSSQTASQLIKVQLQDLKHKDIDSKADVEKKNTDFTPEPAFDDEDSIPF